MADFRGGMEIQRQKTLEAIKNHNCGYYYEQSTDDFSKIPGSPMAYWVSDKLIKIFKAGILLQELAISGNGMTTGNNEKFLRLWHEVNIDNIKFSAHSHKDSRASSERWYPYNKGGKFRKWYGNNDYVVNWYDDGIELRNNKKSILRNQSFYFKKSVSWSKISAGKIAFRLKDNGFIFDVAGTSFFADEDLMYYMAGFCNSNVGLEIAKILSPTMNYEVGHIASFPIITNKDYVSKVTDIVLKAKDLSKQDWDTYETSWDFKHHPLIRKVSTISEAYDQWKVENNERFDQLKANEEELNRIFIDIYGLQDELTPEVADKDVTVHKIFDTKDDVPEAMKGSNYVRTKYDEVTSFISYAVGCMFGRYSLDVDGLAYAGGNWDDSKYTTFEADKDSIIPISDDEYFDDDIVNRFVNFVEVVYGEDTLQENLKFIADALGGKGHPKEVIRNYFLNKFYKEHCKTYQKRPIYWLFDSGKKNGFKCLVYMHRYQPDTIARIRTDYVHEQQARYYTIIEDLEARIKAADTGEKIKLKNQLKVIKNQDEEIKTYEEKIHHLADQMISIDLDDGVKNNYELFKDVLAKIR